MSPPSDAELDPDRRPDGAFEELWLRVERDWHDDKVHAAFLEYARLRTLLPLAAGRYRTLKDHDPERAAKAQRQLDKIMALALTLLNAERGERDAVPHKPSRKFTYLTLALSLISVVWLALQLVKMF